MKVRDAGLQAVARALIHETSLTSKLDIEDLFYLVRGGKKKSKMSFDNRRLLKDKFGLLPYYFGFEYRHLGSNIQLTCSSKH